LQSLKSELLPFLLVSVKLPSSREHPLLVSVKLPSSREHPLTGFSKTWLGLWTRSQSKNLVLELQKKKTIGLWTRSQSKNLVLELQKKKTKYQIRKEKEKDSDGRKEIP
jgi:hypothetical protein